MTVAKPFTQRDIEVRARVCFEVLREKPLCSPHYDLYVAKIKLLHGPTRRATGHERQTPPTWDFNEAVDILARHSRILTGKDRRDYCDQIDFICRLYRLERLVEAQETSAAKASAFQKERRWHKRRQRPRSQQGPRLPQALEQEAARLQATGKSADESFDMLRDRNKRASRPGRGTSHALIHTLQRLQMLASRYAPALTWAKRNIPTDLIIFLVTALDAAGIRPPDFGVNPSKFRSLMIKPPSKANRSRKSQTCMAWLEANMKGEGVRRYDKTDHLSDYQKSLNDGTWCQV